MRSIRRGIVLALIAGARVPATASASSYYSYSNIYQATKASGCHANVPFAAADAGPAYAGVSMGYAYFYPGYMTLSVRYGRPGTTYTVRYCAGYFSPPITAGTFTTDLRGRATFSRSIKSAYSYDVTMIPGGNGVAPLYAYGSLY